MSIIVAPSIDSATWWLNASNVLYVAGAVFTALTAAWIVYETRAVALGKQSKFFLLSEVSAAISAIICVVGTVGAIHYGNLVGHLKDVALDTYKISAGIEIAKAKSDAADAEVKAEVARNKAELARKNAENARQKAEAIHTKAEEARQNSLKAEADAQRAIVDKEKILHDNLELQKQVENERVARLQLEQRVAPRNLTKVAQDRLIAELKSQKLTEVDLVTFAGNAEAANVASQLQYAFENVGAKVHHFSPLSGSLQGILIEYDMNDVVATKGARSIADALAASGMQQILSPNLPPIGTQLGAYSSDSGAGTAKIRILVGSK